MSSLPLSFSTSQKFIYDLIPIIYSTPILEKESADYDACTFTINNQAILFRSAKITPTKIGQFVTLWKRAENGPIAPFDDTDPFDFVVVCASNSDLFGQFVFPKSLLIQKGIISTTHKEGKRAFRVYPSWDKPTSKQAQKTQDWQVDYFYEFSLETSNEKNLKQIQEIFNPSI